MVNSIVAGYRMPVAVARLGSATKVALFNGKHVWGKHRGMMPTCNVRIQHGLAGIMRAAQEKESALAVEAAMSEVSKHATDPKMPKAGYSGLTPTAFTQFVLETAEEVGFEQPLVVHVDHTTVPKDTTEAIEAAREQLGIYLEDGVAGSFSVDASYLEPHRNTVVTADLARPIVDAGHALEVEVGEIGKARSKSLAKTGEGAQDLRAKLQEVSTVWEVVGLRDAVERAEFVGRYGREPQEIEKEGFLPSLINRGIHPDLLAIDNGSKHGNYKPGEEVSIFLGRTADIANAIARWGVGIAQHGISGTPESLLFKFINAGIVKGNIGTNWQNIAHEHMDPGLHSKMVTWAKEGGFDIKHATKQFLTELTAMEQRYVDAINQAAYESMLVYIDAFRCAGSGPEILQALAA
jgi:fructose-bisphosphate aldolase class II